MRTRVSVKLWLAPLCYLTVALCACLFRLPSAAAFDTPPPVQKTATFTAFLTHFQASLGGSSHNVKTVTTTLRLQNTTEKPLILGYVHGSGSVTDDQGNRYLMGRDVFARGMGEINGAKVAPTFLLKPGASADTMLEFYWLPTRKDIQGTQFTLNFTVRDIVPLSGSQDKLGAETLLEFRSLSGGTWVGATPNGVTASSQGPLSAEVTELRTSKSNSGNNPKHVLTATVQLKNTGDTPLILAYEAKSGLFIDNLGNRYDRDAENGHTATGIGTTYRGVADPQLILQPGETKTMQFQLWRFIFRATTEIGDKDTLYLSLAQLEILPSKQIRETRQYSLTFPDLTAH